MALHRKPPVARDSAGVAAPRTGLLYPACPNPECVALPANHFGEQAWRFECPYAAETYESGNGFVVTCSRLDGPCRVENGQDVFVSYPNTDILKSFIETSMRYLGFK